MADSSTLTRAPACGRSEILVEKGNSVVTIPNLACGIGLAAFDSVTGHIGLGHFVLPTAAGNEGVGNPGKYADMGIKVLVQRLEELGVERANLQVAFCGGATSFGSQDSGRTGIEVGKRNAAMVQETLDRHGLKLIAKDVGGNAVRNLVFTPETGEVVVQSLALGQRVLCSLRGG